MTCWSPPRWPSWWSRCWPAWCCCWPAAWRSRNGKASRTASSSRDDGLADLGAQAVAVGGAIVALLAEGAVHVLVAAVVRLVASGSTARGIAVLRRVDAVVALLGTVHDAVPAMGADFALGGAAAIGGVGVGRAVVATLAVQAVQVVVAAVVRLVAAGRACGGRAVLRRVDAVVALLGTVHDAVPAVATPRALRGATAVGSVVVGTRARGRNRCRAVTAITTVGAVDDAVAAPRLS